jgi:hypothetical protein
VPAVNGGFEGQFHGAHVHITGDLAGEGREIPLEVPLVADSPVAAAPKKLHATASDQRSTSRCGNGLLGREVMEQTAFGEAT